MRLKPPAIIEQMTADEDWCDILLRNKVDAEAAEATAKEDITTITECIIKFSTRINNLRKLLAV